MTRPNRNHLEESTSPPDDGGAPRTGARGARGAGDARDRGRSECSSTRERRECLSTSEAEEELELEEARGGRSLSDSGDDEESEGEDLFGPSVNTDYAARPDLDVYDPEILDDSNEHAELTAAQRLLAEREMLTRDRQEEALLGAERSQSGGLARIANLFTNFGPRVLEGGSKGSRDRGAGSQNVDHGYGMDEIDDQADMTEEDLACRRKERFRQFQDRCRSCIPPDPLLVEEGKAALPDPEASMDGASANADIVSPSSIWDPRISDLLHMVFEGFLWHKGHGEEKTFLGRSENPNLASEQKRLPLYIEAMERVVRDEESSLVVDYEHLANFSSKAALWLSLAPLKVLSVFDEVVTAIICRLHSALYAGKRVAVRFMNLPVTETVRGLSIRHLNKLICIEGVCVRRSNTLPRLKIVYFRCLKCHFDGNGPIDERLAERKNFQKVCIGCQSNGPFALCREKTVFENFQKLLIQESASEVPPGHVPRNKVVVLLGDLVEAIRPGESVRITGVLEARPDIVINARNGFPIFATWLVANAAFSQQLRRHKDATEQEIEIIHALSRNPDIRNKIINSIAPSIWGHSHVKTAIAMAMFGGVRRGSVNHTIRGDINVLIIGDPSLGKSQFLKFVQRTVPRSVLTTGKGASAVGLTASVRRDPHTGEWTLEGGAFVQADGGVCLIDEFDKMSDRDRVSIHEAMEQQSISISKAGIVASLKARCAVIAAANPIGGCYNSSLSLSENIDLGDPVISRFDVICVVKDQAFPIHDESLADHVLDSHMQGHPGSERSVPVELTADASTEAGASNNMHNPAQPRGVPAWVQGSARIPTDFLRHYVSYARRFCAPEMRSNQDSKLVEFYVALRSIASGGMPITVRHLESVVRMATANAKMRLAPTVERQDLDHAIATLLESFIQVQRQGLAAALSRRFSKYRALACSPGETLSTLISSMIKKRLNRKLSHGALLASPIPVAVPIDEIRLLASILHSLPEAAITEFMRTAQFKEKYDIVVLANEAYVIPRSTLFQSDNITRVM